MNDRSTPVAKFRPLLSEVDVEIILDALASVPPSVNVLAVRKKLALFQRKVRAGIATPAAFTASEVTKRDVSDDLGISEEEKAAWMEAELERLIGPAPVIAASIVDSTIPVDLGSPFGVAAISI